MNERDCSIDSEGILNYYHFDKPGDAKGMIDLKSAYVALIKFSYAGAKQQTGAKAEPSHRPTPDVDDEFRITMANSETFIFRASKLATPAVHNNPCIEKWEKVIRKFSKNVRVGLWTNMQASNYLPCNQFFVSKSISPPISKANWNYVVKIPLAQTRWQKSLSGLSRLRGLEKIRRRLKVNNLEDCQ